MKRSISKIVKKVTATAAISTMVLTAVAGLTPSASAAAANTPTNENGVELPDNYWDRKVVGYFPNYAFDIPAHKNFDITQLQWDKLTHVQYAFVVADETTFELVPSAPETDVLSRFEDREFYHNGQKIEMKEGLGYYGQFNLMQSMKELYPDVTVLASTGGWAASRTLWLVTDNEANMRKFAKSAVAFVRKYNFDGLDIDFEFPSETSQSGNPADFDLSEPRRNGISDRYTQFIGVLRDEFDQAALEDDTYYWLTSAVSASSWVLGGQTNSNFLNDLDFVSIMSYDYHGGWNNFVENQANIYADPADKETASMAMPTLGFDWSMNYYRGKVQSEKILMGVPYYTRGWTNVSGGVTGLHGTSSTPAVGNENIWHDLDVNSAQEVPAGANPLWHVLNLMESDSNYQKYWDPVGRMPHIWNEVTKTFLTFEDEQSIQERINFVEDNNLGGVLIWVMHGDYDYDATTGEYGVGDTLTTMIHDQFEAMEPAQITSDIDINAETADFDVNFGGKYDHPNYVYDIQLTNNTGEDLVGYTFSFDIPKSAIYGGSWGGTATTADSETEGFTTVTIQGPEWQNFANGSTVSLTGSIKLNFADVKNFKLNGKSMLAEVEAERARLARLTGTEYVPTQPTDPVKPTDPTEPVESTEPTEPVESTEPTEPVESTEPVEPTEPTEPVEPTDPIEPTEPVEPTDPVEPTEPTEVTDPTDSDSDDEIAAYDPEKEYSAGDLVRYNGATYRAKWWTKGDIPETQEWGPWELIN